jgi:hypothetical protein
MFTQEERQQLVEDRAEALRRAARPGRRVRTQVRRLFGMSARI